MCEILFIQGLFWVYIELWKTVKSEQQTGFKHLYTTTRINLQTTRDVLSLLQSARTCYITVTVDKCSVYVQINHTLILCYTSDSINEENGSFWNYLDHLTFRNGKHRKTDTTNILNDTDV